MLNDLTHLVLNDREHFALSKLKAGILPYCDHFVGNIFVTFHFKTSKHFGRNLSTLTLCNVIGLIYLPEQIEKKATREI